MTLLPKPLPLRTIAVAALLALGALSQAQAQSLKSLVEAARGYDASFVGAKSSLDAARYRVNQAEAGRNASARALLHQATHDKLTGLPNRTVLMQRLQQYCHSADGAPHCALMCGAACASVVLRTAPRARNRVLLSG